MKFATPLFIKETNYKITYAKFLLIFVRLVSRVIVTTPQKNFIFKTLITNGYTCRRLKTMQRCLKITHVRYPITF